MVLDGVGGTIGGEAFGLIADGGRFSAHGTPSGSFALIDRAEAERRGVAVTTIADLQYGESDRSRLIAAILGEIGAGRVAPLVGQTFSLAEASKAHLAIESRETVAKTLLCHHDGDLSVVPGDRPPEPAGRMTRRLPKVRAPIQLPNYVGIFGPKEQTVCTRSSP